MAEEKSNKTKIVIMVLCLALAAGIFYWIQLRGKTDEVFSSEGLLVLKCMNNSCGKVTSISQDKFQKMMQEIGHDEIMMSSIAPIAFECPECKQKKAYIAHKCPNCNEIYIPVARKRGSNPYKCPKCGHVETK